MRLRKILFWMHLATGCLAGAVVLVMSVTGVLLAYQRQITAWMDRDIRSTAPSPGSVRLPIETVLAGGNARNEGKPSAVTVRSSAVAPAQVTIGRESVYLVDVYTGRVLGESAPRTRLFFRNIENLHRWLGASNEHRAGGRMITGFCNLCFLVLILSGPFLWIPGKWSWRNVRSIVLFRRGLAGRARDFNWHNVFGIWCAAPLFAIVLSGVVMSYPWANNLVYRLTGNPPPVLGNGRRPEESAHSKDRGRQNQPPLGQLNHLWARAEKQVPGWRSVTLRFPPSAASAMTFTIEAGDGGRPDQRSQLTLDRRTGEIVRWEPFSSNNTGRRLRSWLRFVHTGEAGGIAGQTVAASASTGAAMLVWTGLWLAGRRLLRWKSRARSTAGSGEERPMLVNK